MPTCLLILITGSFIFLWSQCGFWWAVGVLLLEILVVWLVACLNTPDSNLPTEYTPAHKRKTTQSTRNGVGQSYRSKTVINDPPYDIEDFDAIQDAIQDDIDPLDMMDEDEAD